MFPVPSVPGTLPLVGHRVTSSHNKSSAPVGLHRYSTLATRTCAQGGRAAAHHGCTRGIACARRAHTHSPAQPSARRYLSSSLDMETARWKRQTGRRGGGRTAATRRGSGRQGNRRNLRDFLFLDGGQIEEWSCRA